MWYLLAFCLGGFLMFVVMSALYASSKSSDLGFVFAIDKIKDIIVTCKQGEITCEDCISEVEKVCNTSYQDC